MYIVGHRRTSDQELASALLRNEQETSSTFGVLQLAFLDRQRVIPSVSTGIALLELTLVCTAVDELRKPHPGVVVRLRNASNSVEEADRVSRRGCAHETTSARRITPVPFISTTVSSPLPPAPGAQCARLRQLAFPSSASIQLSRVPPSRQRYDHWNPPQVRIKATRALGTEDDSRA
ncbi:hypothetical protein MTO96_011730 [Rhipicephalus appendiculatus]